jgi:flagellar biosynthesis/type III secretory pathway protein FliH
LVNLVETYVELDPAAREEYRALLAEKGHEEVAEMEMTWADRMRQEGREEARESALREGLEKGIEMGKRDLLLEQLEHRFGPLSKATVKRVQALTSPEELSRLAARVLDAPSLDELGL